MARPALFLRGSALALTLVLGTGAAMAQDEGPPPSLPPALAPPLAAPQSTDSVAVGDFLMEVYKLPGQAGALCVTMKTFPNGDKLGFLVGHKGYGLIFGQPTLKVREGTSMDFGFSVDGRPPLAIPGQAYDPGAIMTVPLPSPEGEKILAVFTKGKEATIGSNDLKFRSTPMALEGSSEAVKALETCAKANSIIVETAQLPPTPAPTPAGPGAAVAGSSFDDGGQGGGGGTGVALPAPTSPGFTQATPPAEAAPPMPEAAAPPPDVAAVPPVPAPAPQPPAAEAAPTSPADEAIRNAISAEAKKRKAGVGYAVAMPKDVTGDRIDDVVLLFVLLEGKERKGYVTVLKTTGPNKFQQMNTVALGGIPTNDPPLFTDRSMIISLESADPAKPRDIEILISAKALTVKKK